MHDKVVVSFAKGSKRYTEGVKRLVQSFKDVGYDGDFLVFTDENQVKAPQHYDVPYAFKAHAIREAWERGYTSILWCDSVIHAIKPVDQLFEHIESEGYCFFDNLGFSTKDFTNKRTLEHYNTDGNYPMIMACVMGFNVGDFETRKFLKEYINGTEYYKGNWEDHRHDQSIASIVINELGMNILTGHQSFFMYKEHIDKETPFGKLTKAGSVCLLSS